MGTPSVMLTAYDAGTFLPFHVGATPKNEVVTAPGMLRRVTVSLKFDAKRILTAVELPKDEARSHNSPDIAPDEPVQEGIHRRVGQENTPHGRESLSVCF
jgi:hypothetical protein